MDGYYNQDTTRPYVLDGADPDDVYDVALAMRESDRHEAHAFGLDYVQAAHDAVANAADVYTAYQRNRPTFIFGTVEVVPGVRQLFGFGTPDTKRVIPQVTWFTRKFWLPNLFEDDVRRIQAHIPDTSIASLQWLQSFGMYREASMAGYGVNGETILQLAFTKRELDLHVFFREHASPTNRATGPGVTAASEVELGDSTGSRSREEEEEILDGWFRRDDLDGWPG